MTAPAAPIPSASVILLRDAEIAAFHARELGGGRWVRFEPGLRDRLVGQTRIEHDLREALEAARRHQPLVPILPRLADGAAGPVLRIPDGAGYAPIEVAADAVRLG